MLNDSPVDCQTRGVTEPQRDRWILRSKRRREPALSNPSQSDTYIKPSPMQEKVSAQLTDEVAPSSLA